MPETIQGSIKGKNKKGGKEDETAELAGTELDAESQLLLKEAELTGIDPEILRAMDAVTRAALVQKAKKTAASKLTHPMIRILLSPQAQAKAEKEKKAEEEAEEDEESASESKKKTKDKEQRGDLPIDRVRWMYEDEAGWKCHSVQVSAQLETARREGKKKFSFRVDGEEVMADFFAKDREMTQTSVSENVICKLRRHVLSDGFASHWELMSARFAPPLSLRGQGALSALEKVWSKGDTMDGQIHGLGFLFLYSLLQGKMRTNVISSGWSYWEMKTSSASSDSHRFAMLLAQLYADSRVSGICGSIISILTYNKNLCGRMPSFRDTRKVRQTPVFNGWTDEREPRSPLHTLFSSLVTTLRSLKRKKGAVQFPPRPPYPELDPPPKTCVVGPPLPSHAAAAAQGTGGIRPILTDFACAHRALTPVSNQQVLALAERVDHALGSSTRQSLPPVVVETPSHFTTLIKEIIAHAKAQKEVGKGPLIVVDFFASWCQPCVALAPIFTRLAMLTPASVARFLKVDVDDCDSVTKEFEVEELPTVKFFRGGCTPTHVVKTIVGGGPQFLQAYGESLQELLSPVELVQLSEHQSGRPRAQPNTSGTKDDHGLGTNQATCAAMATSPLQALHSFCTSTTRAQRGLAAVNARLPFDLTRHDTARTAVAKSMLARMKNDINHFADSANSRSLPKILGLLDQTLRDFFQVESDHERKMGNIVLTEQAMRGGRDNVQQVLEKLQQLRDEDTEVVQALIPLLTHAANHIDLDGKGAEGKEGATELSEEKVRFLLRRQSGQEPVIWLQFLFSALLSSDAQRDLQRLNPYLSVETVSLLLQLVTVLVLRANRVGHINRSLGDGNKLLKLLDDALSIPADQRQKAAPRSLPKILQAGEALAKGISAKRHYIKQEDAQGRGGGQFYFDPRFLIFEFTWNILLRQKQVEIVVNFIRSLKEGRSRVKQMIMGAGKTTVVAPLLALILADGQSLVLSVVPRALLEMSRQRMRETFATIMAKRIYTLNFERSTLVSRSLHTSLQNAIRNRGIVVATPTAIKSIMLSYVETLMALRNMSQGDLGAEQVLVRLEKLKLQAQELAKVLQTFREGVMLLDEVDLILHPLKSELNFPLGEKSDLDVSAQGERWGLPIHLMDAIFFSETGQVSTVEGRGVALEILKRLALVVKEAYETRALQRLPHITLLNQDFYQAKMKPILAEWAYLWLLQHHLHGISYEEALRYLLEGAATRSAASTTVQILHQAIETIRARLGYSQADRAAEEKMEEGSRTRLETELSILAEMQAAASEQDEHVQATYRLEQQQDERAKAFNENLSKLQERITNTNKEIEILQFPRDDSLDNSTVVWVASAFSREGSGSELGASDSGDSNSVHNLASKLEDQGYTLRRCETAEEAAGRALELAKNGRLRCVLLAGGGDMGCSATCTKDHGTNYCDFCSNQFQYHKNHMCEEQSTGVPQRGFFPDRDYDVTKEKTLALLGLARLGESKMSLKQPFPIERIAIYMAPGMFEEDQRLLIWNSGVTAVMDGADLLTFVEKQPPWETEEQRAQREQEAHEAVLAEAEQQRKKEELKRNMTDDTPQLVRPPLTRQISLGTSKLQTLQRRLEELEGEKAEAVEEHEVERKRTQDEIHARHARLAASINAQLNLFRKAADVAESAAASLWERPLLHAPRPENPRPTSMRDAASALAYLTAEAKGSLEGQTKAAALVAVITALGTERDSGKSAENLGKLNEAAHRLREACVFLEQTALASKVMALVALQPKKLLNLAHDWLRTFLPHCLGKVNRVSFGLLSETQCQEALAINEHTPRSRLKLAVPFVGKDVPSTSSEFAHPDVIIGLSVLAYRYNGLRRPDFDDLIDHLTSDFSREMGPSRERASSRRHETWVLEAGGTIRGIKAPLRGLNLSVPAITTVVQASFGKYTEQKGKPDPSQGKDHKEGKDEEGEDEDSKEVVQLKYLQKSNEEQAGKLYELWRLCPQVIHYYLNRFIFPAYMRSQKVKISASGQAVGGDMLIGRRVGFSGTPSDLLPRELGDCDYEEGDDGKMLSTVLDPSIASSEQIPSDWDAAYLLSRISQSKSPRFHALIDTGALITGYSNLQVAQELLARGLKWCDGVVFLDDADKQQVLVRATGRVVPADQCGVPLERRFAFYDQIHTTGMDIKHLVNARAVLTLGKDMVFRDYVQGAFRMRGIGEGQSINIYIIPEVAELMQREIKAAQPSAANEQKEFAAIFQGMDPARRTLTEVVAWLVINSMRSEQVQWNMLCLQNVANIYRKNAFKAILRKGKELQEAATIAVNACSDQPQTEEDGKGKGKAGEDEDEEDDEKDEDEEDEESSEDSEETEEEAKSNSESKIAQVGRPALVRQPSFTQIAENLDTIHSLDVFAEPIDFSLEAGVPDVVPFTDKLKEMLGSHTEFILTDDEHKAGQAVLQEVGQNALIEDGAKRLDTEQEREQEQEQQKEVQARRDQQIEVEKFVDREYSRMEESPRPWHISMLSRSPLDLVNADNKDQHPFYPLSDFKLRYQEPLKFPGYLFLSRNYFNPDWSGLRRVKNVVMLLEWSEDVGAMRVLTPGDVGSSALGSLTRTQDECLQKAFTFLRHHASLTPGIGVDQLSRQDVAHAIQAVTDREIEQTVLDSLLREYGRPEPALGVGPVMDLAGLRSLLLSGRLHAEESHRFFVAVSLAEAETLRRILHLHPHSSPLRKVSRAQFALRYTPMASVKIPGSSNTATRTLGDGGGVIFDASVRWRKGTTGMTRSPPFQLANAYNIFKYFDSEMHFSEPALNVLVRALNRNTPYQREMFFTSTIGCRRRMARKWQDTPLAKLLSVVDEWSSLKQRAHAVCIREALRTLQVTLWEAFTLFDSDNNGSLSAAELYGAVRVCKVPGANAEDVVDLLESADRNRDGALDYREFLDLLSDPEQKDQDELDEQDVEEAGDSRSRAALLGKVEPYGSEELRVILVRRKQAEMTQQREEKVRRQIYQQVLDRKLFEEELAASAARPGGANPKLYNLTLQSDPPTSKPTHLSTNEDGKNEKTSREEEKAKKKEEEKKESSAFETVEWQFLNGRGPLRCTAQGGTLKFPMLRAAYIEFKATGKSEMQCPQKHGSMEDFQASWYECVICKTTGVDKYCRPCNDAGNGLYTVCLKCYDRFAEREEEKRLKHVDQSTVVQCPQGVHFSLQVPVLHEGAAARDDAGQDADGVVDVVQCRNFTLTVELLLEKLPPKGQLAALYRFSPASMGRARSRHRASVYVDHTGNVGDLDDLANALQQEQEEKEQKLMDSGGQDHGEKKKEKRLQPGVWQVVTVVVDAVAGEMSSYVDGNLCRAGTGLVEENLTIRHQLQLLGGGKLAHARGGCVRRLLLQPTLLNTKYVADLAYLCHRNLLGCPVALCVDSAAAPPIVPVAGMTGLPLQSLMPSLTEKLATIRYTAPRQCLEPLLLLGSEAAPHSVKHSAERFLKDRRLHICVVNLQPKVWTVGLSILELLQKAVREFFAKEYEKEDNAIEAKAKEVEEKSEVQDQEKDNEENDEGDEIELVEFVAYCDQALTLEEQEKLTEMNVMVASSLEQLWNLCQRSSPQPLKGEWVAEITRKPQIADEEQDDDDDEPEEAKSKELEVKKEDEANVPEESEPETPPSAGGDVPVGNRLWDGPGLAEVTVPAPEADTDLLSEEENDGNDSLEEDESLDEDDEDEEVEKGKEGKKDKEAGQPKDAAPVATDESLFGRTNSLIEEDGGMPTSGPDRVVRTSSLAASVNHRQGSLVGLVADEDEQPPQLEDRDDDEDNDDELIEDGCNDDEEFISDGE
eukprot:gb/GEZN01000019.1/.p1 GENE.gb/GEZN01000019.1/~~gb/GEZN01000019.1/.p1  ORF type:complete len:4425 (-),score=920.40 gb/GEZN01000019.1/:221-11590(-)